MKKLEKFKNNKEIKPGRSKTKKIEVPGRIMIHVENVLKDNKFITTYTWDKKLKSTIVNCIHELQIKGLKPIKLWFKHEKEDINKYILHKI